MATDDDKVIVYSDVKLGAQVEPTESSTNAVVYSHVIEPGAQVQYSEVSKRKPVSTILSGNTLDIKDLKGAQVQYSEVLKRKPVSTILSGNTLDIKDLNEVIALLERHGYSKASYHQLGLRLKLFYNTLEKIKKTNREEVDTCFTECLVSWLRKADDVENPTIDTLIAALRRMGENAVADSINEERESVPMSMKDDSDIPMLTTSPTFHTSEKHDSMQPVNPGVDNLELKVDQISELQEIANKLQGKYDFLVVGVKKSLEDRCINVQDAKMLIKGCLKRKSRVVPKLMPCFNILEKVDDFESFFEFLTKYDFIGYLNYGLLKKLSKLAKDDDKYFFEYEKEYAKLLSASSFQDLIPLFEKQSDLSPTAPLGLPYISFRLERPWLVTSVYTWVSTFGEFSWSHYALFKQLRKNCIIITYGILPSVLDDVMRDLNDPVILKKLEDKGVTVIELPEEEEVQHSSRKKNMADSTESSRCRTPEKADVDGQGKFHEEPKVFNDPIHGHITLHPLLVAIIDTPQFQRLRYIKQLGGGYYVFPGASHNRFEHSIGVCHLAGEFVKTLQSKQPELNITDQDVLCVQIAGLCHDLGHGPFSHVFDQKFIKSGWKHEVASIDMLDHLIKENNLLPILEKNELDEKDLIFIKEMIKPPKDLKGRDKAKYFLYEIVCNEIYSIDVDKWDYFARDCHCLGITNNFDHKRYMAFAKVFQLEDGRSQICYREKEAQNLYEMFHTRYTLHRRAYQHKTKVAIEMMIADALKEANDHLELYGVGGKVYKISESIKDMVAYTTLTDFVLQMITMSREPKLKKAQSIVKQLEKRQHYKLINQLIVPTNFKDDKKVEKDIFECRPSESKLEPTDIRVVVIEIKYGIKNSNDPFKDMLFFSKEKAKPFPLKGKEISGLYPESSGEAKLFVYCTNEDVKEDAGICFNNWCIKSGYSISPSRYMSPQKDGQGTSVTERGVAKKINFD